jgi:hypothetical protein
MSTTSKKPSVKPRAAAGALSPEWLGQNEATLEELLKLPANWNSYGATPIRPDAVQAARDILGKIVRSDTPQPAVVPTVRGGVQLEWHTQGIDLEIEIPESGQFHVWYEDPQEEIELHHDAGLSQLPRLIELVARLSRRQERTAQGLPAPVV